MSSVFTEEARIRRVWDNLEIKNVMARHVYFHEFGLHTKELNEIWVSEPAYAATASFGQSWGFMYGLDKIRAYYAPEVSPDGQERLEKLRVREPDLPDTPENRATGMAGMHTLSTPVIEIAEDGKTAMGMWYTPGHLTFTEFGGDGEPELIGAEWMYEKYAVDFVRESDGEWKIWHLFVGTDWACPAGKPFAEQRPFGGPPEEAMFSVPFDYRFTAYDPTWNWPDFPAVPQPYGTYDETRGYGPMGHPNLRKEAGK